MINDSSSSAIESMFTAFTDGPNMFCYTRKEPVGVVGAITPVLRHCIKLFHYVKNLK